MTFTIVGRCPRTGKLGIATASASLACGSAVPGVKPLKGAIASQAFGNPFYRVDGLHLLERGLAPVDAVSELTAFDPGRDLRQVLIVDGQGRTAAYTGSECLHWAGHRAGEGYVAGGNRLTGEVVLDAMARAYEDGWNEELPERLVRALEAGQEAGGDAAGRQSAALLVFHDQDYRLFDLRVDDHPDPVKELRRLFEMKKADRRPWGDFHPTRESLIPPGFLDKWPEIRTEFEKQKATAEVGE